MEGYANQCVFFFFVFLHILGNLFESESQHIYIYLYQCITRFVFFVYISTINQYLYAFWGSARCSPK